MTKTLTKPDKAELEPNRDMIQFALAQGAGIDVIERLVALREREQAAEAKRKFMEAMNACQKDLPTVIRDKINQQTNKAYAPVETIKTYVKGPIMAHGFSLAFTAEVGAGPNLTTVHLDTTHVGGHTERTTLPNVPLDNKGPKGGDVKTEIQGLMSSMSYAQGRLIMLAFNLTIADEDRDGQFGTDTVNPEQAEEITRLLEETKSSRGRFYEWLKVSKVEEIKVRDLPKVMGFLEDKLRQNGGGK